MSANFPLDGVPLKFPETGRPNKLKPSECPDSSSIDPRLLIILGLLGFSAVDSREKI